MLVQTTRATLTRSPRQKNPPLLTNLAVKACVLHLIVSPGVIRKKLPLLKLITAPSTKATVSLYIIV